MIALLRRVLPTLALTTVVVGAAVLALGMPNLGLVGSLFGGGYPTMAAALAVVSLVVWVLIGVGATWSIGWAGGVVLEEAVRARRRRTQSTVVLALGLMVFGVGVMRHVSTSYRMCCGDRAEAQQLVR